MIPLEQVVSYHEDNENVYQWVSEYIFSLRTNSNGLEINWDEEHKLPSDVVNQYLHIDENVYLKGMDAYSEYTKSFRERVKFAKYALFVIIILFLIIVFVYIKIAPIFILISALAAFYMTFSFFNRQ